MKWFAWYPVQLESGRWVWWKWIRRDWDLDGGNTLEPTGWCVPSGGWKYFDE